jgi:DNA-binding transcriptional ArsR family regulator
MFPTVVKEGMTMAEFEEETYSTIFAALKHPIRRRLLRFLHGGPGSFTDILNSLNINSPILTYHLETLKDLVFKTEDGKYRLSSNGEGAVALMQRVEEAPKPTSRTALSPRRRRVLRLSQIAAIAVAIALLLTGGYLFTVISVQFTYTLPTTSWSIKEPTVINGTIYDTFIKVTTQGVTTGLTLHRMDDVRVIVKDSENFSQGIITVTLRYVEYSLSDGVYIPREENFTELFLPSATNDELAFSEVLTMPGTVGASIDEQPLPRDITVTMYTNTTEPLPGNLISIGGLTSNGWIETQPYVSQAAECMAASFFLLVAAIVISALLAQDEHEKLQM